MHETHSLTFPRCTKRKKTEAKFYSPPIPPSAVLHNPQPSYFLLAQKFFLLTNACYTPTLHPNDPAGQVQTRIQTEAYFQSLWETLRIQQMDFD